MTRRFAWQAWDLATSTFVLRGGCGTGRHLPSFRVAGVALGDIHFLLRGRCGTSGTGLARVARLGGDWSPMTPWRFAWQAWHLATSTFVWHLAPSTFVLRGRCGTHGTGLALVACLDRIGRR